MPRFDFQVELRQPVIISQQTATAGAHESLDYLPGSVFLGLAAARLYRNLPMTDSWTLFHSGCVRFGDALPISRDQATWPVPLSWHHFKGEPVRRNEAFIAEQLFDPSSPDFTLDVRQPVQLRGGYVSASGVSIMPARDFCMKTAIDRETGLAAESQLFGYEALRPGQPYQFSVNADNTLAPSLLDQLVKALTGEARLGRSRSAQFGAVAITRVEGTDETRAAPAPDPLMLTLWLLSDLQLVHQGQPILQPVPKLLGLPAGSDWMPERSFLRSRRYSSWNGWRRHHDPERQVISRGSVLRYRLQAPLTSDQLQKLENGLGVQVEAGLGHVWVNPPLLNGTNPVFSRENTTTTSAAGDSNVTAPSSALIRRLQQRAGHDVGEQGAQIRAEQLFTELCARVCEARSWHAVPQGVPLEGAPGRSQWGRIKAFASDHRGQTTTLLQKLTDQNSGMLRGRSGWELSYGPQAGNTLGNWLTSELERLVADGAALDRVLGHLAVLGLQPRWEQCCDGSREVQA